MNNRRDINKRGHASGKGLVMGMRASAEETLDCDPSKSCVALQNSFTFSKPLILFICKIKI